MESIRTADCLNRRSEILFRTFESRFFPLSRCLLHVPSDIVSRGHDSALCKHATLAIKGAWQKQLDIVLGPAAYLRPTYE